MKISNELYIKLLSCNLNNINLSKDKIEEQRKIYFDLINNNENYPTESPLLKDWYQDTEFTYPNIDKTKKKVINILKKYNPKTILEAGSGSGKLSKYIYDILGQNISLTCAENNINYYRQMQTNFTVLNYMPKIYVKARTILGSIHDIKEIDSESIEMVFTHTVLMHIPFSSVVEIAAELARISSKYILHVENKNDVKSCVYPTNLYKTYNNLMIDYRKLYDELGFETLFYEEELLQDNSHVVTYLGKRI